MKKITLILCTTAAIAAVSCEKENLSDKTLTGELVPMSFTAGTEATKVQLQSDQTTIHWENTDKIKVYDCTENDLSAFTTDESGPSVTFSGKATEGATEFYAVHPYSAAASFDVETKTIYLTLPETQTASAGNLPKEALISVAKSATTDFSFKNITGFIRFSLKDATDVKSVIISGNAGESLTGDMKVTFGENGMPSQVYGDKMNYTATLTGGFESNKDYYIAVRTAKFEKGITVSIYRNDGSTSSRVYRSSASAPSEGLDRNEVMDIGELDVASFKSSAPTDQFLAYLHGYNVKIGNDITVHKNTHKNVKLISTSTVNEATSINSYINNVTDTRVYFLDSSENCKFTIANACNVKGNIYLIGRLKSEMPTIMPESSAFFQLVSGGLYIKNTIIDLSARGTSYFSTNSNATENLASFYIDNCLLKSVQGRIVNGQNNKNGINEMGILNSDIHIAGSITLFNNLSSTSNIIIHNNVFFNDTDTDISMAIFDKLDLTVNTVTYTRNTIVNCSNSSSVGGYIRCNPSSLIITNNLFKIPNLVNNQYLIRNSSLPTSYSVAGNYCTQNFSTETPTYKLYASFQSISASDTFTNFYNGKEDYISISPEGYYTSTNSGYGAIR